jgi:hypothetical protein
VKIRHCSIALFSEEFEEIINEATQNGHFFFDNGILQPVAKYSDFFVFYA